MKKYIFIVFAIALGVTATAQKNFYIYNFSSYDITVSDIITKHVTNDYPQVYDNLNPLLITANGGSIELFGALNNRFPYTQLSPTYTTAALNRWIVQTSATTSNPPAAAAGVELAYGTNQVFKCIKFESGSESRVLGAVPFSSNEAIMTEITGLYEEFQTGSLTEYTIVNFDN